MVKEINLGFCFLWKQNVEGLRVKMGFVGAFVVDLVDCSGGLALLWRENKEVEIQFFFPHMHKMLQSPCKPPYRG
jgi:hypothetical protein